MRSEPHNVTNLTFYDINVIKTEYFLIFMILVRHTFKRMTSLEVHRSGNYIYFLVAITPKENHINTVSFTDLQRIIYFYLWL